MIWNRLLTIVALAGAVYGQQQAVQNPVQIRVAADQRVGVLAPVWSFFGYDEPNYTYGRDGQKLLTELSALSPVTVHVRAHNLLTSGDGAPALKWGSTNAYTEDAQGRAKYDWTIVDRIFDTYHERHMKPLVEIGFMPEALSVKPQPYQHHWDPAQPTKNIYTGWAQPPKDYAKWSELVYEWVRHCIARYGRDEVASWYWEVWNEPNIAYWQSTVEEYEKFYDFTADAVKRALPGIQIGGPTSTGPGSEQAAKFLQHFLEHVVHGKNAATGQTGAPLDYISFHAKGRPKVVEGHVQMGSEFQLRDMDRGFAIVASFPELKSKPIIIGESDPEGCAACSVQFNPQNAYRNGTMYSSYTAATFARLRELAARHGVNLRGAVTWAFEFEGQPYFAGFRDLATNGLDKPVLNVFRMFGLMGQEQLRVQSSGALALDDMLRGGVKQAPDVNAIAARTARGVQVLMWNYHDDDQTTAAAAPVETTINGLPANVKSVLVRRDCVDHEHSNSYTAWQSLGSPQQPTAAQYGAVEAAGQLQTCGSPTWMSTSDGGSLKLAFALPRQGVSLIELSW